MQINQLPAAASLNLLDKFAVDATDGVTKSITAQALRDLIRANSYGAPLEASTVAGMTDTSKVYVYTGNESGYTNGNWYYYNGTAWVSGGAYNSVAVNTDTTLTLSGVAADARATGTAIQGVATQVTSVEGDLQQEIDNIFSDLATAYEALTFPVSEGQYCVRAERVYKANQDIPTPEAWNSSHWTLTNLGDGLSDLGDVPGDIATLNAAIVTERLARQTADTSLNNAISAEATAREQAVAAEASAREAADTALNGSIIAEASARNAADTALNGSIIAEATAREAADDELKSALNDIVEPTRNLNNQKMGRYRARASGVIVSNAEDYYYGMSDMVSCTPGEDYTATVYNITYSGTLHIYITWYDSSKAIISQEHLVASNGYVTATAPDDAAYIYANCYVNSGITYSDTSKMQIEEGTAKTAYVSPYAPKGVPENTELINAVYKKHDVSFPFTAGYISNTSGRLTGSDTRFISSDFINLANIHKIVCNSTITYNSAGAIAFYTSSKTFINAVTLNKGTIIANISDIPVNAYYIRICLATDDTAVIYSIDTVQQTVQNIINSDREETTSVNFIKGIYIKISDGQEAISVDWKSSPFIDVDDLYSVTLNSIRNINVSYVSFYDSTKTYISGVLPTAGTELKLYKGMFPENTKYVRLCISAVDTNAYCYYTYANNSFKNTLKYICFGDSITSDEVCGIGTIIAQELNAIQLGNFAHGNATLSDWHTGDVNDTVETPNITTDTAYNANVLSNQVRNALAYATEVGQPVTYTHPVAGTITLNTSIWTGTGSSENVPDIIYIAIGTNDGGEYTPVVNNADTVNQQTYANLDRCSYASSLRWALETLIAKFPYAEIYVATPLHTAEHRMNGKRSYDVMNLKADLIKNVCRFCSVNVIDSYAESGVSSAMESEFFGSDGLHPVAKWRGYIARYVANKIKQNYIQRP